MRRHHVLVFALALITLGCGGDSPTSPSDSSPSPSSSSAGTVTGFVRETSPTDAVGVPNARVEIVDGPSGTLTGNFVLTDATGFYRFTGLAGGVSFRASKEGYEGDPKRTASVLTNNTITFNIMPVARKPARESIGIGDTRTGTMSGSDATCGGMFFRLPCRRFTFTVGTSSSVRAQLQWTGTQDIDLELWRDDTFVVASLVCQSCGVGTSQESFTRVVPPGDYELRLTWFQGGGSTPYTVGVMPAQ